MDLAADPQTEGCAECRARLDPGAGPCAACLMRWATATEAVESLDFLADEMDGPRIGSYELLGEIGRGGMGIIYRARQIQTGRHVALKILQNHFADRPQVLSRFRREAQAAASLDHPHVLPIYEVNEEVDGIPYFTMKLAEGGSLVDRRGSFLGRPREIAALVAKVARAAHHAHQRGVLHRDLKPGNILFDREGEPMLSDFGLAAWLHQESDLTQTLSVFGTPGYLPPEHLNGRPDVLLATSDLYSLGVILFELLASRLPFLAETTLHAMRLASEKPAPLLRTLIPGADRELETICARCLEMEPALRYADAGALADDLEHWLAGRPIHARRTPAVVVAWKWARRHPAVTLASLACVLFAGTAILVNYLRTETATALARATAYDRSIVVLPVEDLDRLEHGPLAAEATQALLQSARRDRSLITIAPSSAPEPLPRHGDLVRFSQLLGGRYILASSIRRKTSLHCLTVHLLDAASDTTLARQVLEIETLSDPEVGAAIGTFFTKIRAASQLPVETAPTEIPTNDRGKEARRLAASYLQAGDQHFSRRTPQDTELAIAAYEKACSAEPESAGSMARLASALVVRSFFGDRNVWLSKAFPIVEKAGRLAPELPEVQRTLSDVLFYQGNFTAALDHAFAAFELEPHNPKLANTVADTFSNLGQFDRALAWNRKASLRQNAPAEYAIHRGDCFAAIGEIAGARRAYQEFIEFRPELPDGYVGLAYLDFIDGKSADALRSIRDLRARFPSHPVVIQTHACLEFHAGESEIASKLFQAIGKDDDAGLTAYLGVRACSALGFLALQAGDPSGQTLLDRAVNLDTERLSTNWQDPGILIDCAASLAALGRSAEALATIRGTIDTAPWNLAQLKLDPRFHSLREVSEFADVLDALTRRQAEMRERCAKYLNSNQ